MVGHENQAQVDQIYEDLVQDDGVRSLMNADVAAETAHQISAVNGTVCGSSATQNVAAEQGAGDATDSYPRFRFPKSLSSPDAQPLAADTDENEAAKILYRHMIAPWKREVYYEVLTGIIDQINDTGAELWKSNEEFTRQHDAGPPIVVVPDLSGLALSSLEPDGITEEEIPLYEDGDLPTLVENWKDQWSGFVDDDHALSRHIDELTERAKAIARTARERGQHETTTQTDSIKGFAKPATDWGDKNSKTFSRLVNKMKASKAPELHRKMLEAGIRVLDNYEKKALAYRRFEATHPVTASAGWLAARGLARFVSWISGTNLDEAVEVVDTADSVRRAEPAAVAAARDALFRARGDEPGLLRELNKAIRRRGSGQSGGSGDSGLSTPPDLTADGSAIERASNLLKAAVAEGFQPDAGGASSIAAPKAVGELEKPRPPPPLAGFGANRERRKESKDIDKLTKKVFARASRERSGRLEEMRMAPSEGTAASRW